MDETQGAPGPAIGSVLALRRVMAATAAVAAVIAAAAAAAVTNPWVKASFAA